MITKEQLIGYIKTAPRKELSGLIATLEKELGVKAVQTFKVPDKDQKDPEPEEQNYFDVILTGFTEKVKVIKVVRAVTGMSLMECKIFVEGAPAPVKRGLPHEAAQALADELEEATGTVEIK